MWMLVKKGVLQNLVVDRVFHSAWTVVVFSERSICRFVLFLLCLIKLS